MILVFNYFSDLFNLKRIAVFRKVQVVDYKQLNYTLFPNVFNIHTVYVFN